MKKIAIKLRIAIFFTSVTVLSGCNEWMNLEPENDLIKQEFWQKEADVDAVLAAMYDAFRENAPHTLYMGEIRADMIIMTGNDYSDYAKIGESDISPSSDVIGWTGYYNAINLANTLIEYMPDVRAKDNEFTQEEMMQYTAEALFLRSLTYFNLVRLYKEVPYVTSASSSDTINFFVPKSSEREILNNVIEDLKYAESIAKAPLYIGEDPISKGRANKYSIQALIADIYIWLEDYENCLEYCNKVINSGKYVLLGPLRWFENYYPGNSIESIFEIQYNDQYDHEDNAIYDALSLTGAKYLSINYLGYSAIFTTASDIRNCSGKTATFKYVGKSVGPPSINRDLNERDANIIYYRLADILLLKAECLTETGKFTEAREIINNIRIRAGLPSVQLNDNILDYRELLLQERAREFALEGKRWFDVLRFSKKEHFKYKTIIIEMILGNVSVQLKPVLKARVLDTMSYYLPIPQSDINFNPNLVQNPYYDR